MTRRPRHQNFNPVIGVAITAIYRDRTKGGTGVSVVLVVVEGASLNDQIGTVSYVGEERAAPAAVGDVCIPNRHGGVGVSVVDAGEGTPVAHSAEVGDDPRTDGVDSGLMRFDKYHRR